MFGAVRKFAMNPKVLEFIKPALANDKGKITAGSLAGRFAPDAFFGVLAASQTPGDMGDKIIAGTTSALGGGLGGAGVTTLTGGRLGQFGEFAGGFGGDYLGMMVGDQLSRGKDLLMGGSGQTPYERMSEEQQRQFAAQLEQQILSQYGILPGTREQYADPTTGMGVA